MKRFGQIAVIVLFVGILWAPLIGTPFRFSDEHEALTTAERRFPNGSLSLKESHGDVELWVKQIQAWYEDSFAFRSQLMRMYNISHYLIHSYPNGYFGRRGYRFRPFDVSQSLDIDSDEQWAVRSRSLGRIQKLCDQQNTPCVFFIIPTKAALHPELAPRWLQRAGSESNRNRLVEVIREQGLPVVDLISTLRGDSQKTGRVLFRRQDVHWRTEASIIAYRAIVSEIQKYIPDARLLSPSDFSLKTRQKTKFSRRYYLDSICSEPFTRISEINRPPLRIVEGDVVRTQTVRRISCDYAAEVFREGGGGQTVVFVRDSFLQMCSPLLNHSFSHTVYLNQFSEGQNPWQIIETYHPDVLVFAMHERVMGEYLDRIDALLQD